MDWASFALGAGASGCVFSLLYGLAAGVTRVLINEQRKLIDVLKDLLGGKA